MLEDDGFCFACGRKNPIGLNLSFSVEGDVVRTRFTPVKAHQGYKDIVHGGIITTVLDEAMAKIIIEKLGLPVTAEIAVRFREPLRVAEETEVEAKIERASARLIEAGALMRRLSDGKTVAVAKGKLLLGS